MVTTNNKITWLLGEKEYVNLVHLVNGYNCKEDFCIKEYIQDPNTKTWIRRDKDQTNKLLITKSIRINQPLYPFKFPNFVRACKDKLSGGIPSLSSEVGEGNEIECNN